jgi:hypothetical protein
MSDGDAGDQITHCEWCGAEYPEPREAAPAEPRAAPPAGPPAGAAGAEPATHCEWCGAEYPVPGAEGA